MPHVLEVVTIWFGVSIVRFVGRGYAGVLAFIPATVGAILVNTLPSSNKIGLLFSYWVSSKSQPISKGLWFVTVWYQFSQSRHFQYSWDGSHL
jgi:hypothetical protein